MATNRLDILKKVEMGEISLEEAAGRLAELETEQIAIAEQTEVIINDPIVIEQNSQTGKKDKPAWSIVFWMIPLIFGVLLTVFSSTWLYQNYVSSGLGFQFWLTWIPFLIGVFLIYIGWALQSARWIHVNIKQPEGESPRRIFIAFPIPFQWMGFFLKLFKRKFPSNNSGFDIEEIIRTLDQQLKKEEPLYVHVDDEDGSKVEIYIG